MGPLTLSHSSLLRACGLLLCLALLAGAVSAASTDVRVVKLASDGKTVLAERTVDYRWLEANLPVKGDGSTHYYHQGPTFDDADLWDPTESKNVQDKDMGAVKGTALRDLCGLAGGMSSADSLVVRASDGFTKRFSYKSVYAPSARQGQMVLTWYRADEGYVPSYSTGMRVVFYADTSTNPWGLHVFGNEDMKASMPSSEWHYFNGVYPTTTGLSIQSVSELRILSTQAAAPISTATTRPTTTPTATKTAVATTQAPRTPTTKATTLPGSTGAPATPTTAQGATPVPSATTAFPIDGAGSTTTITTAPTSDGGGPVVITTTGTPAATVSALPTPTMAATATPDPAVNGTTVTPSITVSPVPTTTGYDRTYDYSISTGLDYTADLEATGTATATPTPTATANGTATETPAASVTATPALTPPPPTTTAIAVSPSPTAPPNGRAVNRSLSFTLSFQVRESGDGPAVDASPGSSWAIISPASPLGALWAFLKAVARLIDPFFT